jgi:hypothetical protein
MSGTGTVNDVYGANVPDTDEPALKVIVDRPGRPQVAFFIPIGTQPLPGEAISWDARHATFYGGHVKKISWEMAP